MEERHTWAPPAKRRPPTRAVAARRAIRTRNTAALARAAPERAEAAQLALAPGRAAAAQLARAPARGGGGTAGTSAGTGGGGTAGTSAGTGGGGTAGTSAGTGGGGNAGSGGAGASGGSAGTGGAGASANGGSGATSGGGAGGGPVAGAGGGPSLPPAPCDYTEQSDIDNGFEDESTDFTITGTSILCGQVDIGHYGTSAFLIDSDSYAFTVPTAGNYLVKVDAPGTESLGKVTVELSGEEVALSGGHAVIGTRLKAGEAWLTIRAENPASIATPIPYKVAISLDTSCPTITTAADYVEAHDGADSRGNDVYLLKPAANLPPAFTNASGDVDEPTGLTLLASNNYRLSGLSGNVIANGAYLDGDAYAFRTGPTTDQLAIRLDWPGTTRDLDYVLFADGGLERMLFSSFTSYSSYEFKIVTVKPNTTYHLWVAAWNDSTNLPVSYDASICASSYAFPVK